MIIINLNKLDNFINQGYNKIQEIDLEINKLGNQLENNGVAPKRKMRYELKFEANKLKVKKKYYEELVSSLGMFKNGEIKKENGFLYWDEEFFKIHYNRLKDYMRLCKKEDMNLEKISIDEPLRDVIEKHKRNMDRAGYKGTKKAINIINSIKKRKTEEDKYAIIKPRINSVFGGIGLKLLTIVPIKKENQRIDSQNIKLLFEGNKEIKFPRKLKSGMANALFHCLERKTFAHIMNPMLKNTKSKKITKFKKEIKEKLGPQARPFFARAEITTKGYYFVLAAHNINQPLMLDWNGKTLNKKQGELLAIIHSSF